MSVDSYAPCPCGSGKKVKFCCQAILPDMEKVERLLENNQPRMAIAALEKVLPTHAGNAWVATAQGWALIADHRPADAKAALAQFLRKNPDHPSANALHALAAFQADGFPTAKKAIHRAFRRSFRAEPSIVSGLAASMAEALLSHGHVLASRQHYALALRYGDEEDRKAAFSAMVDIDGDAVIPYPLRGVHNVPEFIGKPESHETIQKAHRLSAVGCWEEAAELLQQAVDQQPDSAEGWQTLALFRAWDGNDKGAAEAFRKAANLLTNFENAVECETLAQLLEMTHAAAAGAGKTISYVVDSVSRLLTRLDEQPRCARLPAAALQMAGLSEFVAAQYDILDRPAPAEAALGELTLESAPHIVGRAVILNETTEQGETKSQRVLLYTMRGSDPEAVKSLFQEATGDSIQAAETEIPDNAGASFWDTGETAALREQFYLPHNTPIAARERVEQQWQAHLINELWPSLRQKALEDRTPREAKGVTALRVPLAAAISVLDAFCDSRSRMLPVNEIRKQYDLPEMEPVSVAADANVNLLSLMQLRRVNLKSLSDEQFRPLLRRVLLSRHNLHAYETLREYIEQRPQLQSEPRERDEVLQALVDICRRNLRRDEAIRWAQQGQTFAKSSDRPFDLLLGWKMKELTLRLEDKTDPQGKALFDEVWTQFGSKLPALRDNLLRLAEYMGIEPPGQGVVIAESGIGAGGVGMSLEPAGAPTGEKKLWLPGMD
jgi:tetratricopeptide (TPR) repeat protein